MEQAAPSFLGKIGKSIFTKWQQIITERSGWRDEFIEIVGLAAGQYELYVEATEKIKKEGGTVTHRNGAIGQNPWVNIQQSAFKNVLTFSNRFGLNPQYSNKVDMSGAIDDSEI